MPLYRAVRLLDILRRLDRAAVTSPPSVTHGTRHLLIDGTTDAEQLDRKLQRQVRRRMPERAMARNRGAGGGIDRRVARPRVFLAHRPYDRDGQTRPNYASPGVSGARLESRRKHRLRFVFRQALDRLRTLAFAASLRRRGTRAMPCGARRHQLLMQIALPFLTNAGLRQLIERWHT